MYSVIIQLYADDAKVFSNNVNDLQSLLGRVYIGTWLLEHQLLLAPSKCEHLCISCSFNSQTHNFCADSYNTGICSVTAVKDPGVHIQRNLTWSHCSEQFCFYSTGLTQGCHIIFTSSSQKVANFA